MTATAGTLLPGHSELVVRIDRATRRALGELLDELGPSPLLDPLVAIAFKTLDGGKRLRGLLCLVGASLASGEDLSTPSTDLPDRLAAALELYQASALSHDDLIDHSPTRRGNPTPHVALAEAHRAQGWQGSAQDYGRAGAVLLGDLLLSAADHTVARLAQAMPQGRGARVLQRFTLMHAEVALGQYLDVRAEQVPLDTDDDHAVPLAPALEVVRRKSARYSVVHPLALGILAAGGEDALVEAVSAAAEPWGTAFQLRDDDLGVFGETSVTGKPTGGDLREGKRTPLLALTWQSATPAERLTLAEGLGEAAAPDPQMEAMVEIVERRGRGAHEQLIDELVDQGTRALAEAGLDTRASSLLGAVAALLTRRRA